MKFKQYDTVKLKPEFEQDSTYTVVETNTKTRVVSLFPVLGGFACAAHESNLILNN